MKFPEELRLKLRAYITGRSGLYFKDYDLKDLEKEAGNRMAFLGIDSPLSYYELITASEGREAEFRELLNLLTVNHTYFFRNEAQFTALKEKVLPELIEKKIKGSSRKTGEASIKPSIKIWSAGCSSGEEPYTIAIVLKEMLPNPAGWDIEVLATDVSTNALKAAREGVYRKNSIKTVPKEYLDRYFTRKGSATGEVYVVGEEIKRMVKFDYHNMIEDPFGSDFDIIFCRNVVIYFDLPTMIEIMNRFYASLRDGGYIFLGYSETLQYITGKFRMQEYKDAIYYRRLGEKEVSSLPAVPEIKEAVKNLSRSILDYADKEIRLETKETLSAKIRPLIEKAMEHMYSKNYSSALSLVQEASEIFKESPEPYFLAAQIHANKGEFGAAKEWIHKAIKADRLFAPAHYLLGEVYMEEGDLDRAKAELKKSLYLDKDLIMPNLSLAELYRQEGLTGPAKRQYRITLKLLSKHAPDDIILFAGGFNAASIASVCKDNLERLRYSL